MTPLALIGIFGAGVLVGVLSAMFGVGGGIVMVPFIVLALEKSQHVAEGTSLLVVIPTAIVGVILHRRNNYVSFHDAGLMALGGLGGAYAGAVLALALPADTLQALFGIFLALIGLRTIKQGIVD